MAVVALVAVVKCGAGAEKGPSGSGSSLRADEAEVTRGQRPRVELRRRRGRRDVGIEQ